ncbi:MAG: NADH-quinone oxidoreductase subunit NuoG [Nitrospirota bacterium]
MATIYVDNVPYEVEDGQNLLEACLTLGFDIPYFCWHPALDSVGACRLCAVKVFKDEEDAKGELAMSCMTLAEDGTRLSVDDLEARAFRAKVIEWLMINHPHDCPVCDEGGECHLQDMTEMTGHVYRRYRFTKRTYRNQYLGPLVNHEMNRCIQCYRCVRFYKGYAGGRDLDVLGSHDHVYFGRYEDGVLESEFSGNLAEVCPTGVFTDKTLKGHYTRKWDLQSAPSVCVHCAHGCNTIAGERYESLRVIRNRYNSVVNGYFLCDRGRFGYEFVNSPERIGRPLLRESGWGRVPVDPETALRQMADVLHFGARVVGVGSPRASVEANFLLRELVGPENFYAGVPESELQALLAILAVRRTCPAPAPTLQEAESSDAVFVLGEDISATAPRMALALRQSVRQGPIELALSYGIPRWEDTALRTFAQREEQNPLSIATPAATRIEDIASRTYRASPGDIARLGFAVAHALAGGAPGVSALQKGVRSLAEDIAGDLKRAKRPLVISGAGAGTAAVHAAANVARALAEAGKECRLYLSAFDCNSIGLALMSEKGLGKAYETVRGGGVEAAVILEADLYARMEAARAEEFLDACRIVVLDSLASPTAEKADLVLPAATFAEGSGTLVNSEGRAQRFFEVFPPPEGVRESWRWLRQMMLAARWPEAARWETLDALLRSIEEKLPRMRGVARAAPSAGFRVRGLRVPRQPHRYSGRTAMHADRTLHEPRPPEDPDSPLDFSMEGYPGTPPPSLIPRLWAPGWNSVQAVDKYQKQVGGVLRGGSPGVPLLRAAEAAEGAYYGDIPEPFARREGRWLLCPLHHVFGSEELSARAPGIAALAPKPYVALGEEDAQGLGASGGEELLVVLGEATLRLPLVLKPELPRGVAGLPSGLPGLRWMRSPLWGEVRKG